MSAEPNPLPDFDAGVLARELGLDPDTTTSLRVHVEARWIAVRWSGYKRVKPAELEAAIAKATEATNGGTTPARRKGKRS